MNTQVNVSKLIIDQVQELVQTLSMLKDGKPVIFLTDTQGSIIGKHSDLLALICMNMIRYDSFRDVINGAYNAYHIMSDEEKESIKADFNYDDTTK